jgi:hypothetical protein
MLVRETADGTPSLAPRSPPRVAPPAGDGGTAVLLRRGAGGVGA